MVGGTPASACWVLCQDAQHAACTRQRLPPTCRTTRSSSLARSSFSRCAMRRATSSLASAAATRSCRRVGGRGPAAGRHAAAADKCRQEPHLACSAIPSPNSEKSTERMGPREPAHLHRRLHPGRQRLLLGSLQLQLPLPAIKRNRQTGSVSMCATLDRQEAWQGRAGQQACAAMATGGAVAAAATAPACLLFCALISSSSSGRRFLRCLHAPQGGKSCITCSTQFTATR